VANPPKFTSAQIISLGKIIGFKDLHARGVTYARQHIQRLVKAGKFPKPFKLNGGGRVVWFTAHIDEWLLERARASGITIPDRDDEIDF
jgi:predicted DNA-binding transcriptional regulator AlpA